MDDPLVISASITIDESLVTWRAMRAAGPGGQHVNKVSTKVELRFDLANCDALNANVKKRVRTLVPTHAINSGTVIITEQGSRSQSHNLSMARKRLVKLVQRAMVRPKRRVATKPTRGSQRRRIDAKKRRSKTKAARSKVRRDDE